jgi:hypothetical protein
MLNARSIYKGPSGLKELNIFVWYTAEKLLYYSVKLLTIDGAVYQIVLYIA